MLTNNEQAESNIVLGRVLGTDVQYQLNFKHNIYYMY